MKISTVNTSLENINQDKKIKLTFSDNFAEIISSVKEKIPPNCRRLSSNQYIDKSTGAVKDYSVTNNRILSVDSLRKTYKRLELIIKSNFIGNNSEVFLTLGYDSHMNDYEKLKRDFYSFRKKFDKAYPDCNYIVIVEYKSNGDLHMHILIKHSSKKLFLDRDLLINLWGQNAVYAKHIDGSSGVDNLTRYLNPFKNDKKFGRLMFYKRNFRIYRRTKGIKSPKFKELPYNEAIKILKDNNYKKFYSSTYNVIGEYNNGCKAVLNDITIMQFRKEV